MVKNLQRGFNKGRERLKTSELRLKEKAVLSFSFNGCRLVLKTERELVGGSVVRAASRLLEQGVFRRWIWRSLTGQECTATYFRLRLSPVIQPQRFFMGQSQIGAH